MPQVRTGDLLSLVPSPDIRSFLQYLVILGMTCFPVSYSIHRVTAVRPITVLTAIPMMSNRSDLSSSGPTERLMMQIAEVTNIGKSFDLRKQ